MAELDEPLSERELEVLEQLVQGASNKAIAGHLFISPNTVKVHLRNINTKLGASSRTEASRIALEKGLVTLPGMELVAEAEVEAEVESDLEPAEDESPSETDQPETEITVTEPVAIQEPAAQAEAAAGSSVNFYWIGAAVLILALLGVVGWFMFGSPNPDGQPQIRFEPEQLGESRWFTSRDLPESLSAASAVSIGTDIFVMGGQQPDGEINADLHVYDSAEHQWRTEAVHPQPVINGSAISLAGFIYVVGGEGTDGQPADTTAVYSPTENLWQQAASLPKAVSDGLVISDGASLYHLGGDGGSGPITDTFVYDPATNEWSELPPLPSPRAGATGGVIAGNLFMIGGLDEAGEATADCFKFALVDESWSECASMGNRRSNGAGAVILNRIYVFGGETGASFGEVYNPESDIWEIIPQPMLDGLDPPNWSDIAVSTVEAKVYVMGGEFNGSMSADAFYYSPLVYQSFIPSATNE